MKLSLFSLALLLSTAAMAQQRKEIVLSDDWQFSRDGQSWQSVSVPHDWAISGPFDKKWDLQVVRIEQNGEKEATEKSGRSGALPWLGKGYYKRHLSIPAGYRHAELVFDGAMAEPRVRVNGQEAGYWAYGYNTFRLDITPLVKQGDSEPTAMRKDNLLEVDLQNLEESSRWYPGAGIYRPVTLVLTDENWIDPWGTFIRTTQLSQQEATVQVTAAVGGPLDNGMAFEVELRDRQGRIVAQEHASDVNSHGEAELTLRVASPQAWSPESPYLYKATVRFMQYGKVVDQITRNVGLRTVSVSKEGGFRLNGVTRKLKGVCLHHDLGPLGAAVNKAAIIRQIRTMKDMGCDAIRTAHNMPSQMQMDVCDSLGMMVMAESFDMWIYPKCKNGYARFFKEWSDRDIDHLVRANRNHPSIVMWSIGNEIPEQGMKGGKEIARHLQELCHGLDPTRPVTQGMDRIDNALSTGFAQVMDVPGMNYRVHKYQTAYDQLPQGFLLGSETASTVSSRGIYKFPVKPDDNSRYSSWAKDYDPKAVANADGQCSGYDVEYCSWSNLPDDDWRWQDDYPWVIGEFVWTGYDYLGEPTPYDEYWPSRSSYFGICDLAGLPKDRYYLYRSKWQKEQHTLHLLPHWSWGVLEERGKRRVDRGKKKEERGERREERGQTSESRMGLVTPVYCYTDYDEAELFLNGKSQGRIKKCREESGEWKAENRLDRYRLRWNDVRYEPGELRVVAYDKDGRPAAEQTLRTAGKPARLQLSAWTQASTASPVAAIEAPSGAVGGASPSLKADGDDLAFVTVALVDKDGTFVPTATDRLRFEVSGAGTFRACCNGDATSLESFTEPTMHLFAGQLVVVVQAAKNPGTLTLRVTDEQLGLMGSIDIPVIQ